MEAAVVSASNGALGSLPGKLGDLLARKYKLLSEAKGDITFLKAELESMHVFLKKMSDVEEPDEQAKCWAKEVRELSYDIEDSVDEFMLRVERDPNSEPHGLKGLIKRSVKLLTTIKTRHKIAKEFQAHKNRVMEVSERRGRYMIDGNVSKLPSDATRMLVSGANNTTIDPRMLAIYVESKGLVGMQGPREELIQLIKHEEGDESPQQPKVLSIVGFGGLGKTTLANEVYRNLKGEFDCQSFVPVSQRPNIWKILRKILSDVGYKAPDKSTNMELLDELELAEALRTHLEEKRYFIVIDDIWDASAWNIIRYALPANRKGSRVITTTRIEIVAIECCSNLHKYVYKMKPLGDKDSRKLFLKRIFDSENVLPSHLEEVLTGILKKCSGLPLAIITVSSLLAAQQQKKVMEQWEHVLNSLGSNFEANPTLDGMRRILNLSYINLPYYLKTCMLYLGIYPEDHIIYMNDLVRQWVAQGFISEAHGKDPEDVGEYFFNELINRSIIQPAYTELGDDVKSCRVHDMMLDLIIHKCSDENFITAVDGLQPVTRLGNKIRRLSLYSDSEIGGTVDRTIQLSQIRALGRFGSSTYIPPLLDFKHLRVLILEFPSRDGKMDLSRMCHLFHLRYLKIRCYSGIVLPRKIGVLQQLETLDITDGSQNIVKLPSGVVHLRRLLHLISNSCIQFTDRIGSLKSLRTFQTFYLHMNSVDTIRDIGYLTKLRHLEILVDHENNMGIIDHGKKQKQRCMLTGQHIDALRSSLEKLCDLRCLIIREYFLPKCGPDTLQSSWDELNSLCSFPRLLQELDMFCFSVPKRINVLHNLYKLRLDAKEVLEDDVNMLSQLPSLISLSLKIRVTPKVNVVICGTGFAALKRFDFSCSRISFLTFMAGAMPRVQKLMIVFNLQRQGKFDAAPIGFEHLPALQEISACIGGARATESNRRAAESVLRKAIDLHPNSPTADIHLKEHLTIPFLEREEEEEEPDHNISNNSC